MKRLVAGVCLGWLLVWVAHPGWAQNPRKDDVPSLIKALKSKSPKTRASAAEDLGHIGAVRAADAKDAVPVLFEMLNKEKDAAVRCAIVTALGKMDPDRDQAIAAFKKALKDKTPAVRSAAALALGQLGPDAKDAIPALQEAQKDKDKSVAQSANMALRSIRSKN